MYVHNINRVMTICIQGSEYELFELFPFNFVFITLSLFVILVIEWVYNTSLYLWLEYIYVMYIHIIA